MKSNLYSLILLLFVSCSADKQISYQSKQIDSLYHTSLLTIKTNIIPESHADLSIPTAAIKELPPGAAFVQKNGQATAEIRFLHDTLFVYATCDSLQALVYQYEEQTEQLHARLENNQTKKSQKQRTVFVIFGLLFILCLFFKWRRVRG